MEKFGRYKDRCDKTTSKNLEKAPEKAEKYPRDFGKGQSSSSSSKSDSDKSDSKK